MTFEEFFTKKRIDLVALKQAEPILFSEFKTHYEQMGEKSFDHTKKFLFNKVRRQYNLPPEIKTEKPKIENPLAEQTVNESLAELSTPTPKLGFTPKFRAATPAKSVETSTENTEPATEQPKLGFTPKFKATNIQKPTENTTGLEKTEEAPAEKPKLGFTPKFKAANIQKPAENMAEEKKEEEVPVEKPKLGFTPKFKAANLPKPPKPTEE